MREKKSWKDISTPKDYLEEWVGIVPKKKTLRQCVRCWVHLYEDQKLRCSKCLNRVDEELNWLADRPYNYYFKRHLKRIKHDKKLTEKLVNTVIEN